MNTATLKTGVYLCPEGENLVYYKNLIVCYELTYCKSLGKNFSPKRLFEYIYLGEL